MDGCCYIDRARDDICHLFLNDPKKPTHLLFIDADMGWNPEHVVRLLEHDKEVICGVYCQKVPEPIFPIKLKKPVVVEDGLLKADAVPAGFLLISRIALEKYQQTHPYLVHNGIHHLKGKKVMAFFQMLIEGDAYYREDLAFGLRWSKIGDLWIDPVIHLRHWNGTQCFQHNFLEDLKANNIRNVA
jgi:hypothetical protein